MRDRASGLCVVNGSLGTSVHQHHHQQDDHAMHHHYADQVNPDQQAAGHAIERPLVVPAQHAAHQRQPEN